MVELAPHLLPYVARLKELPFIRGVRVAEPKAAQGVGADPEVILQTLEGTVRLRAAVKRTHLDQAGARALAAALPHPERWLLLAPYVGRPLGEFLRGAGVNYLDRAGNCFLRLGRDHVAQVEGRRATPAALQAKGVRAAGVKVLFALLADIDLLERPLRTIARAADANPQTALDAVRRLARLGAVAAQRTHRIWLPGGRRIAFDTWIGDYGTVLRPALYAGRYRTADRTPEELDARVAGRIGPKFHLWYGGVAAGHRVLPHYRGRDTVFHVDAQPAAVARELRALPDPDGPVHLLRLPCPPAKEGLTADTVHPLLVYAEMLQAADGRAAQTAQTLRREALKEFA
jgi:hypothetical protein